MVGEPTEHGSVYVQGTGYCTGPFVCAKLIIRTVACLRSDALPMQRQGFTALVPVEEFVSGVVVRDEEENHAAVSATRLPSGRKTMVLSGNLNEGTFTLTLTLIITLTVTLKSPSPSPSPSPNPHPHPHPHPHRRHDHHHHTTYARNTRFETNYLKRRRAT